VGKDLSGQALKSPVDYWTASSILSRVTDVVAAVRRFNRYWTQVLGLLDEGLLGTEHPLPEARVLFELAHRPVLERAELRGLLGIDDSFLSRLLRRLQRRGLVTHEPSSRDGRRRIVRLTAAGRGAALRLDHRSAAQVDALIAPLDDSSRRILVEAMAEIEHLTIGSGAAAVADRSARIDGAEPVLRDLRSGDLGWIVERNAAVYAEEFGWDRDYEALVAEIVAEFQRRFRPQRERAWIAEVGGARAGCVLCKQRDPDTAQLRLLLVEPWARGLGIGRLLVDACITFARDAGFSSMMLWTNDVLVAARRIYQERGFELVEESPHHSFGHDLVGQVWSRSL
jgi:DNA-binding MarR family transcriptional regulator/N-acetylglutamate synthase-like GNAT family acetyltransferase